MCVHHHATACLELTLIALARQRPIPESELHDGLDDAKPMDDLDVLEVDKAMALFEETTLALLEYETLLGLTDPN